MTDRERIIEVMNKALSGLHFPLGPNVDMFHTFADRLIEAGFGRQNGWIRDAEEDRFGAGMGLIHDD